MIYVYAVIEPIDAPLPPIGGHEDRPVEIARVASVAAAYTQYAPQSIPPTRENVWRHEVAIETLMRDRTVLPARFGTTFGELSQLETSLSHQADALAANLDRVRGCVELGLRVLWTPPTPTDGQPVNGDAPPAGSGRAYMAARLAEERGDARARTDAERISRELHDDALASLAREATKRILPTQDVMMTAAYLIARDRAGELTSCVR